MFKKFLKKSSEDSTELNWDNQAIQALDQAVAGAPVPAPLKGKVKTELKKAAEATARAQGHEKVTAEDLMQGMLSKMPANMRKKVEDAIQEGPEGVKRLENEIKNK